MALRRTLEKPKALFAEYPGQFWMVVGITFVDRIGSALMFPFFALYLTSRFNVGMTEVGYLFLLFSMSSMVGVMIGGALTDNFGRKSIVIFGVVVSGMISLAMGLANSLNMFYVLAIVSGIFADVAHPARQAMITDILPEEKRAEGFGVLRVVANLAIAIGPVAGGFLASRSYLMLFVADMVTSLIAAAIFYFTIEETRPATEDDSEREPLLETFRGYATALKDNPFVAFVVLMMISGFVYTQMYSTLSVFLRDSHGIDERGFGFIMSLNASMVVLMQFWITRKISKYKPMLVIAAGTFLYAIGFGTYGFINRYWEFMAAMAVITIGEMLIMPVTNAIVANMAPEDMRGRYMATFGFAWVIPNATGPLLAGLVMDSIGPLWVWYFSGMIGMIAVAGFIWLNNRIKITPAVEPAD